MVPSPLPVFTGILQLASEPVTVPTDAPLTLPVVVTEKSLAESPVTDAANVAV